MDPSIGTFKCLDPRQVNGYCVLNNPDNWEIECPHLQEDRLAAGTTQGDNLASKAISYIKEKSSTTKKKPSVHVKEVQPLSDEIEVKETPQVQQTTNQITIKDWLLNVVGMGIKGPYVEYYFISTADFNTLLKALEAVERR